MPRGNVSRMVSMVINLQEVHMWEARYRVSACRFEFVVEFCQAEEAKKFPIIIDFGYRLPRLQ